MNFQSGDSIIKARGEVENGRWRIGGGRRNVFSKNMVDVCLRGLWIKMLGGKLKMLRSNGVIFL